MSSSPPFLCPSLFSSISLFRPASFSLRLLFFVLDNLLLITACWPSDYLLHPHTSSLSNHHYAPLADIRRAFSPQTTSHNHRAGRSLLEIVHTLPQDPQHALSYLTCSCPGGRCITHRLRFCSLVGRTASGHISEWLLHRCAGICARKCPSHRGHQR